MSERITVNDLSTPEKCREWALNHHPSVKKALETGEATIVNLPTGAQWFGDESKNVKVNIRFLRFMTKHEWCDSPAGIFPDRAWFGEIELEKVGDPEGDSAPYRLVKPA
jgi:hypothetical protein